MSKKASKTPASLNLENRFHTVFQCPFSLGSARQRTFSIVKKCNASRNFRSSTALRSRLGKHAQNTRNVCSQSSSLKRADWTRVPFKPVVENGYLFGRGATDMKLDGTIASLIELKREGYRPRRTIIIEFCGDEETEMETSQVIADKLSNVEVLLNIDGGGVLNEKTGAPEYFTWQGHRLVGARWRPRCRTGPSWSTS